MTSGSKRFFLGTDSAPHERQRKECSCGCAGIFNAPVALSLYAKVFEEVTLFIVWCICHNFLIGANSFYSHFCIFFFSLFGPIVIEET